MADDDLHRAVRPIPRRTARSVQSARSARSERTAGTFGALLTAAVAALVLCAAPPADARGFHDASPAARAVVRPGAFCKASEAGRVDHAADGRPMRCETAPGDARHRWRVVK